MNTFGTLFRITTFGESHGPGIGVVIDGCPAGLPIEVSDIQAALDRRRPGQSDLTTPRKEADRVEVLSGLFQGFTTGTPIGLFIRNQDQASHDYSHIEHAYRPSHADYTYDQKYGRRDYRGGGRSSARETAARVAAGAVAQKLLEQHGIRVSSYVSQVGAVQVPVSYEALDLNLIDSNPVRCPHPETAERMAELIRQTRDRHDTVGGVVTGVAKGVPVGLGEPVFDRLHAELGHAMLSINAVKGFEYGSGFSGVLLFGSEHNDEFYRDETDQVRTRTNHSGGIQGGISNGQDIYFRVAFKPVATILQPQKTLNDQGEEITLAGKGRHDPCVLPRAVPIVDAMTNLVLADMLLRARSNKA
ncbi:chorismate synthase [Hymenobacter taeanensis]|uniref:Chorismate synthase n=1 Tax=Hymenobacter taeanensis TaxID=2735321 RepID=A0A6M6BDT8_9BACT|nr:MULTISPECIES: chorismate synthase [Hymenobacter]QJX46018.1 chorismate synthase [Hymenobacter taeanensis]UOQ79871.1 chorismate synthase [Hymenobacter sp. 5414T-23]